MNELEQDTAFVAELNRKAREEARELEKRIDFGLQVRAFLDSEIGQRLLADAEAERKELVEAYLTLDPDDHTRDASRREIRFKIGVLDHWQSAFARYINEGEAAEAQYTEAGVVSEEAERA
jgi:hypothetical protein